jgi:hypothetical protein
MPDDPGNPQGQALDTALPEGGDNSGGLFHSFTDRDGKKVDFKTSDDLNKYLNEDYMRDKDYRQKTMSHAESVKKFESERLAYDNDRKAYYEQKAKFEEDQKKIERFNQLFADHPDIFQEVQEKLARRGGPSPEGLKNQVNSILKEMGIDATLEDLKKDKEKRAEMEAYESEITALKGKYEDADEKAIRESFDRMISGTRADLLEELYYSHKGRLTPVEIEKRLSDAAAKKSQARLMGGSGQAPIKTSKPKTLRDSARLAKEQAGVLEE